MIKSAESGSVFRWSVERTAGLQTRAEASPIRVLMGTFHAAMADDADSAVTYAWLRMYAEHFVDNKPRKLRGRTGFHQHGVSKRS